MAQPSRDLVIEEMKGERRVALVIGNGAYRHAPLRNPANDARSMAAAMQQCGFEVITQIDASAEEMVDAIRDFGQRIQRGGVGLFYFAGHGLQVDGRNYLIPVEADIQEEDEVRFRAVDVSEILSKMERANNRVNIVILDACRNNPFARSFRSSTRGLAKIDAATGSFMAYATAPGDVASEGSGDNGLYTSKLLTHITRPGIKIEEVFKNVRRDVAQASGRDQIPWDSSSLMGDFYFLLPEGGAPVAPAPRIEAPAQQPVQEQPPAVEVATAPTPYPTQPVPSSPAAPPLGKKRAREVLMLGGFAGLYSLGNSGSGQRNEVLEGFDGTQGLNFGLYGSVFLFDVSQGRVGLYAGYERFSTSLKPKGTTGFEVDATYNYQKYGACFELIQSYRFGMRLGYLAAKSQVEAGVLGRREESTENGAFLDIVLGIPLSPNMSIDLGYGLNTAGNDNIAGGIKLFVGTSVHM